MTIGAVDDRRYVAGHHEPFARDMRGRGSTREDAGEVCTGRGEEEVYNRTRPVPDIAIFYRYPLM